MKNNYSVVKELPGQFCSIQCDQQAHVCEFGPDITVLRQFSQLDWQTMNENKRPWAAEQILQVLTGPLCIDTQCGMRTFEETSGGWSNSQLLCLAATQTSHWALLGFLANGPDFWERL